VPSIGRLRLGAGFTLASASQRGRQDV